MWNYLRSNFNKNVHRKENFSKIWNRNLKLTSSKIISPTAYWFTRECDGATLAHAPLMLLSYFSWEFRLKVSFTNLILNALHVANVSGLFLFYL